MATFIFRTHGSPSSTWWKLMVVASGLLTLSTMPVVGAGYVISGKDRAQAAALSQQAYVTFQSGDYARALGLLLQADQLKPDQPDSWNLRGVILLRQKAYDQAQAAFARAAALDPDLWAARFNLAEVRFQRKDYARARASFEQLLSQTDRFKDTSKWELVQYKALVACVLMGDDLAAEKKLAKLPPAGKTTPAFFYSQAALAFHRKNPAQARKSLAAAQAAFPAAINGLFADTLVQTGWQAPPLPLPPAALASNVPGSPSGTTPPPGANFVVDPQLQAASAGPLPVADAPTQPIVPPMTFALRKAPGVDAGPKLRPAPTVAIETPPAPLPELKTDLENGSLLLGE